MENGEEAVRVGVAGDGGVEEEDPLMDVSMSSEVIGKERGTH